MSSTSTLAFSFNFADPEIKNRHYFQSDLSILPTFFLLFLRCLLPFLPTGALTKGTFNDLISVC